MAEMIAFCGLNCSECPSFLATINDDDRAREKTAAFYTRAFGFDIKPEDINCLGCQSGSKTMLAYCQGCEIRKCGVEKGVENCALCKDQPCDRLKKFHSFSPQAKSAFDILVKESS